MKQEVQKISVKNLVLWTENPRDPIDAKASDQEVVDRALENTAKWSLGKLADEMGDFYDFSELPTVVYHGKLPVVYDGNRRVILAKIKHKLVDIGDRKIPNLPSIPEELYCNVCDKDTALKNVFRKHSDSGSWQPLERDIFLHRFMKEPKSPFLILEDETGIISANPDLNQRFVKEEIFKEDVLKEMGFIFKDDKLKTVHSDGEAKTILSDIAEKISKKEITTRKNRGQIIDVLEPSSQRLIEHNKRNKDHMLNVNFVKSDMTAGSMRRTRRVASKTHELFGGKLLLKSGEVSNLYRDIADLYQFFDDNKKQLSQSFPGLIRMSLRLLAETAAKELPTKTLDTFIKTNFATAKKTLNQDTKTYLSTQNVTENSLIQLLHVGAHKYSSTTNIDQTIAISIILGEILKITHGKS